MDKSQIIIQNEVVTISCCTCNSVRLWYRNFSIKFTNAAFINFALELEPYSTQTTGCSELHIETGPVAFRIDARDKSRFCRSVKTAAEQISGFDRLSEILNNSRNQKTDIINN